MAAGVEFVILLKYFCSQLVCTEPRTFCNEQNLLRIAETWSSSSFPTIEFDLSKKIDEANRSTAQPRIQEASEYDNRQDQCPYAKIIQ
jgi:hypothetical protein